MGGRNGFTVQQFAELSDRQIFALLMVSWDEDGRLITEAQEQEQPSSVATVGRDLISWEQMGMTVADGLWMQSLRPFTGSFYVAMFAQVWHRRGKKRDEILALWKEHAMSDR